MNLKSGANSEDANVCDYASNISKEPDGTKDKKADSSNDVGIIA